MREGQMSREGNTGADYGPVPAAQIRDVDQEAIRRKSQLEPRPGPQSEGTRQPGELPKE